MNRQFQHSPEYGWVCPKCGTALNPKLKYCILCNKKTEWLNQKTITKVLMNKNEI